MDISPTITRTAGAALFQLKQYAPQILTAAGIAGFVGSTVLASKATLSLETTLEQNEYELNDVKETGTPAAVRKKTVQNAMRLIKLYAPAGTLAIASGVAIASGQGIMLQRNAALVGAYKALETTYNKYRQNVIERYGEKVDQDIRAGVRKVEKIDENGKKTKEEIMPEGPEDGAYISSFGPGNPNWEVNRDDLNRFFLEANQTVFNSTLQRRGHVFLNEVLGQLGIPHTKTGAVTGWVYNPDNPNIDNYIDFGIRDLQESHGYIALDFNVDGIILDQI